MILSYHERKLGSLSSRGTHHWMRLVCHPVLPLRVWSRQWFMVAPQCPLTRRCSRTDRWILMMSTWMLLHHPSFLTFKTCMPWVNVHAAQKPRKSSDCLRIWSSFLFDQSTENCGCILRSFVLCSILIYIWYKTETYITYIWKYVPTAGDLVKFPEIFKICKCCRLSTTAPTLWGEGRGWWAPGFLPAHPHWHAGTNACAAQREGCDAGCWGAWHWEQTWMIITTTKYYSLISIKHACLTHLIIRYKYRSVPYHEFKCFQDLRDTSDCIR